MSQGVINHSASHNSFVVCATSVTAASITEPTPTLTEPTANADGIIPLGNAGNECASSLKISFFGEGSNGQAFNANVYGWECTYPGPRVNNPTNLPLWTPVVLATFTTITLNGSIPGINGTDVPVNGANSTTNFFASAITGTLGNSGIGIEIVSPGAATAEIAHVIVDTKGCKYAEIRFSKGTATSANAIAKRM